MSAYLQRALEGGGAYLPRQALAWAGRPRSIELEGLWEPDYLVQVTPGEPPLKSMPPRMVAAARRDINEGWVVGATCKAGRLPHGRYIRPDAKHPSLWVRPEFVEVHQLPLYKAAIRSETVTCDLYSVTPSSSAGPTTIAPVFALLAGLQEDDDREMPRVGLVHPESGNILRSPAEALDALRRYVS